MIQTELIWCHAQSLSSFLSLQPYVLSPPSSSVRELFWTRIPAWVAISSRGSSWPSASPTWQADFVNQITGAPKTQKKTQKVNTETWRIRTDVPPASMKMQRTLSNAGESRCLPGADSTSYWCSRRNLANNVNEFGSGVFPEPPQKALAGSHLAFALWEPEFRT